MKKKQLLKEIMGVPKAINFWVDYFSIILAGMAKSISQSDEMEEAEIEYKNPNNFEEIVEGLAYRGSKTMDGKTFMKWVLNIGGYSDLGVLLKTPTYKELPLYQPNINLILTFIPNDLYEVESKKDLTSPINASHGWRPDTIKLSKMGGDNLVFVGQEFNFDVMAPVSWIENFDTNLFRKMLKPVIGHELTHAYETYKRFSKTGDPMMGREAFLNIASKLTKDIKYPQWNYFLDLVYLSLSFEINARIVQLYNQMKEEGVENQNQFMDVLYKSSIWNEVKQLQEFDAEKFIKSFKKIDLDFFELLQDIELQSNKINQGQQFIKNISDSGEALKHLSDVWDKTLQNLNVDITNHFGHLYSGKLMDKVPQSAKETPMKFFKFFEKRFHKKAENFRRKLLRLSSLILNNEDVIKESVDDFGWFDEIPELSPCEQFIFDKLSDCKLIGSKKQSGRTKYVNKNGEILFLDDINNGTDEPILYVDYHEIWLKCKKMGVSYEEFQKICIQMLYETHKRKVVTTVTYSPWNL
jgi:hypothetical protein